MKKLKAFVFAIIMILYSFLFADPPNWEVITGTQYSMVLIAQATIYGNPVLGDCGNMIGAFGPGGEIDCRSVAVWQQAVPPEDGFWYFTIVGDDAGDLITFDVYDAASDQIYTCNETLIFENNLTIGNTTDPFQLTVQDSYIGGTISLITTTPPAGNLVDVEIQCDEQITYPSSNGYYQIPLSIGLYDVTASLPGYTTITLTNILLQGNQGVDDADITLIDWEQIPGTQYSMVLMTTADIFGIPIVGGIGNIVAAFGPGGDADCRGIAEWQIPNPPYWDGYWYFTIVANNIGELINFKIFDKATDAIYDCYETIEFNDNNTIGSPEAPYNLSNGSSQSFDFDENWNWISFNVHPGQTQIDTLFSPLGSNINQIKSQYESAVYFAPSGTWVGNLTNIEDGEGYLVQMNNPFYSFVVEGTPISPSTQISLDQNWNWVAYYPQFILDIENALNSIEDNVFQVKSQNQSATYYNPPGSWQGDLDFMEPSQGYKIFMNAADELFYIPSSDELLVGDDNDLMLDPPTWQVITGTEFSMILMAEVSLDGEAFTNEGDNIVAAFGPDGENDCRCIAAWQEPYPPYYDGFWYFTIVGNTNGDDISFKLYEETSDLIFDCNETLTFANNETIGSPDDLYQLTFNGTGIGGNLIPQNTECKLSIYPNPFNPSTTISFSVTQTSSFVTLEIYNLKGQKIRQFSIFNSQSSIVWDGTDQTNKPVSSGIYFCKLKAGKKIISKKLILLK